MTQRETDSTVVVALGVPWMPNSAAKQRNAMTMLTIGPPAMTTTFFHHGRR